MLKHAFRKAKRLLADIKLAANMDKKKIRKALWWKEDKNITHLSL